MVVFPTPPLVLTIEIPVTYLHHYTHVSVHQYIYVSAWCEKKTQPTYNDPPADTNSEIL